MNSFNLFIACAPKDRSLVEALQTHLKGMGRVRNIKSWTSDNVLPGDAFETVIRNQLGDSNIILLLISPDFMASDICYSDQMQQAVQQHEEGKSRVIPVVLRPSLYDGAPFAHLKHLPKSGVPITTWPNQDEAFLDVLQGLQDVMDDIEQQEKERIEREVAEQKAIKSRKLRWILGGVTAAVLSLVALPSVIYSLTRTSPNSQPAHQENTEQKAYTTSQETEPRPAPTLPRSTPSPTPIPATTTAPMSSPVAPVPATPAPVAVTPATPAPTVQAVPAIPPARPVVWGIELPTYVVLDSAWKTQQEAQVAMVRLSHDGYSNTGFFWIPDFQFLSGMQFYQVYIGPFDTRSEGIAAVCQYNQKFGKTTYGVKLSIQPGREEIRCGDSG